MGDKLQSLKESEWQKRVALERENTQLQEKVAAHERFITICTYSVIHTSIVDGISDNINQMLISRLLIVPF